MDDNLSCRIQKVRNNQILNRKIAFLITKRFEHKIIHGWQITQDIATTTHEPQNPITNRINMTTFRPKNNHSTTDPSIHRM